VIALAALLGVVGVFSVLIGRGPSAATVASIDNDANLEVPASSMPLSANWKAQPATGSAIQLAWPNIKVNPDTGSEAQNEPFVAVNPSNSKHIVVGANSWQIGNGHFEVFAYTSFDGGRTWTASQPYINRNASRINAADPTVAFGTDGSVYFAFVAMTPAQGAVAVSRSLDGGLTWSSQNWATSFTSAADKPAIASANGNLYLYYQNGVLNSLVSANSGATWGNASVIEAGGRNAYPVVDAKGNVSVFYNTNNSIRLARLTANDSAGYTISTVANATPLQARAAQYRAGIYPAAGVDSRGNMYVAWADGRNAGSGNDILYSRSNDSGRTWSAPVTLNTDGSAADQLMPSLTVSKDGAVTVAWLDTRNDPARVNYDVYMTRSADGANFNGNVRVSNVSSNPNNDPRTQGSLIGDYFALAAGDGVVYSVWTDTRNNNEDIYMAPVSAGGSNN
jgi:hypothetical protein